MTTVIKTKNSTTTTTAPSSLAQGELAVNITDKKVWVGNAATTPVQLLGAGSTASFGAVTATSVTDSGLTSGRVTYAGTGGLLQDNSAFTFDGSTLSSTNLAYSGTLTGGTGVVNLGSGQFYKDASGNVGIGTSSPVSFGGGYKTLEVKGSTTTNGGVVRASTSDNSYMIDMYANNAGGNLESRGANPMLFLTNSAERMRIDSSGNLLVGTTSTVNRLKIVGSAATNRLVAFTPNVTGDTSTACLLVSKFDNNSTTSQVYVQFSMNNDGTASGQINANGANGAAFGSWSDSRLKENIENLPSQLANITALRPVEFDYIESEGGGHQIGFIAQEMQEVYPDVVGERADGMLTVTGWDKTTARLVKAIQELKAELDTVKTELATLKGTV
jgi:hypothetical protein